MKTIPISHRIPTAIPRPLPAVTPATGSRGVRSQPGGIFHRLKSLTILCCLVNPLAADQFGDFTYTDNGTEITIEANPNYSSADGVLFNKIRTMLIQCPEAKVLSPDQIAEGKRRANQFKPQKRTQP